MSGLLTTLSQTGSGTEHNDDAVYSSSALYEMMNAMISAEEKHNNLKDFKLWFERHQDELSEHLSAVEYSYDTAIEVYAKDGDGNYFSTDVMGLFDQLYASAGLGGAPAMMSAMPLSVWDELLPSKDGEGIHELISTQYDVIYGRMPERYDEIVLIVNSYNEITDVTLYALGLKTEDQMKDLMSAAMLGE